MTEKKLKELLEKLDVNHPTAQVIRTILNQYVAIKQTKLTIASLCTQFKVQELYDEVMKDEVK